MAAAIADISGSPIVDDSLENTVQYRQMNLSAAEFIANVDYTENADDCILQRRVYSRWADRP